MKILVIGSGGREHALVWKLKESPLCEKIYAVPGNPGMEKLATCVNLDVGDNAKVLRFAREKAIDLAVIGPEGPLANGIVDTLTEAGIAAFGPCRKAAAIEGSKAFAKDLMKKYGIPTAKYEVFEDAEAAKAYVSKQGAPIVIKADGLAAGKGVVVAMTPEEALNAIDEMGDRFGKAAGKIVVEEFMEGEEASLLAFTDGKRIVPMVSAQDHKRVFDGDKGPNTGGMGTYAPAPVMTAELMAETQKKILEPTIRALAKEGAPYRGCLYAGLMITRDGPKVVEFNARFGDPETQVVLPLLEGDLVKIMLSCAKGELAADEVRFKEGAAVCVILASGGYPGGYAKGKEIFGIKKAESLGALVFHAGTKTENGKFLTNGGRVLGVAAEAATVKEARDKAYDTVKEISFEGMHYRKDIAYRALNR